MRELRERQQVLRGELNTLAGRIESLKAERKGRLVAGAELESALRRSQELSGELTGLAQSLAGPRPSRSARNLALHTALSEELVRVRASWEATSDREARAGLIARMRDLRAERDAVRAALPPSRGAGAEPGTARATTPRTCWSRRTRCATPRTRCASGSRPCAPASPRCARSATSTGA